MTIKINDANYEIPRPKENEKTIIIPARSGDRISIENETFEAPLSFNKKDFYGLIVENSIFTHRVDLSYCLVSSSVRFINCIFKEGIDLSVAKIEGPLVFEYENGTEDVYRIKFINLKKSSVSFTVLNNYRIGELNMEECRSGASFDLSDTEIGELNLEKSLIEGAVILEDAKINNLKLYNASMLGEIIENWKSIENANLYNTSEKENGEKIRESYKILKNNMNRTGRYRLEDEAYVTYKRKERETLNPAGKFLSWIGDVTGGYGTNPFYTLATICVLVMFFSLIYLVNGEISGDYVGVVSEDILSKYGHCLIISASSFLSLVNVSDCSCLSTTIIAVSETFIGLFMMMYLSVSFARRILR